MDTSRIEKNMTVVASDGQRVGTVDCLKGDKVVLAKSDPEAMGAHHSIPLDWVSGIDDEDRLMLNQTKKIVKENWFDAEPKGQEKACP